MGSEELTVSHCTCSAVVPAKKTHSVRSLICVSAKTTVVKIYFYKLTTECILRKSRKD